MIVLVGYHRIETVPWQGALHYMAREVDTAKVAMVSVKPHVVMWRRYAVAQQCGTVP